MIVPALQGYETVLAALDSWDAQSCRGQLEMLVLCPAMPETGPLPSGHIVIATGDMCLHQARAAAILQASADYVVLAEDHCLPDRLWAEAVVNRLAEGWDAVGPALRSGNPGSKWAQAGFLLGYGQWMIPAEGAAASLPGHNVVLRRKSLLDLGRALPDELIVAAFLMRRLHQQGHRFYVDNQATMRHFDVPHWKKEIRTFCQVGMGFGAVRTSRWPRAGRGLYSLAIPAIAARHWWRAFTQYRRAGAQAGLSPLCLMLAALLALAWGCGESAGALLGVARTAPYASSAEIKPVTRSEV